MKTVHGSAVARGGRGLLILGASGSGKSALALEIIARGGKLVSDDAVVLQTCDSGILLKRPDAIKGMIEARGIGLISVASIEHAGLAIVVNMDKNAETRLPKPKTVEILGKAVPEIAGKNAPSLGAALWILLGEGRLLPVM